MASSKFRWLVAIWFVGVRRGRVRPHVRTCDVCVRASVHGADKGHVALGAVDHVARVEDARRPVRGQKLLTQRRCHIPWPRHTRLANLAFD